MSNTEKKLIKAAEKLLSDAVFHGDTPSLAEFTEALNNSRKAYSPIELCFSLYVNEDAEQFEFTPLIEGYTSYRIAFDEVGCKPHKAWLTLLKSLTDEQKRKGANQWLSGKNL